MGVVFVCVFGLCVWSMYDLLCDVIWLVMICVCFVCMCTCLGVNAFACFVCDVLCDVVWCSFCVLLCVCCACSVYVLL